MRLNYLHIDRLSGSSHRVHADESDRIPVKGTLVELATPERRRLFQVEEIAIALFGGTVSLFVSERHDAFGFAAVHWCGGLTHLTDGASHQAPLTDPTYIREVEALVDATQHSDTREWDQIRETVKAICGRISAIGGMPGMLTAAAVVTACNGHHARMDVDRGFDGLLGWQR